MPKHIEGLRRGVTVHTPKGWYINGREPSTEVAAHLKEMGYKLVEAPANTSDLAETPLVAPSPGNKIAADEKELKK